MKNQISSPLKYLTAIIFLIGAGAWAQVPNTPLEQQLEQQAQQLMQQAQQNSQQSQQDLQQAQQDIQQAQTLESQTTTTTTTTQVATQGQTVAGTGANSSARNEKILDITMGAAIATTGGLIMKHYGTQMSWDCGGSGGDSPECHKDHIMFYGVGLGLLAEGAVVVGIGATRSTQIAATSGGTTYSSPGDGLGTGSTYGPTGGPVPGPAPAQPVPIQVQSALQTASAPALAAGINPTNPASVAAARMNAGLSDQDIAGNGMKNLSPEALAEVKAVAAQQAAKFNVANVPLGDGVTSGGGMTRGNFEQSEVSSASTDLDLGGGERLPASIEGMSKLYKGNLIGVASDNIFGMMTRRYGSKISRNSFLEPTTGLERTTGAGK